MEEQDYTSVLGEYLSRASEHFDQAPAELGSLEVLIKQSVELKGL